MGSQYVPKNVEKTQNPLGPNILSGIVGSIFYEYASISILNVFLLSQRHTVGRRAYISVLVSKLGNITSTIKSTNISLKAQLDR